MKHLSKWTLRTRRSNKQFFYCERNIKVGFYMMITKRPNHVIFNLLSGNSESVSAYTSLVKKEKQRHIYHISRAQIPFPPVCLSSSSPFLSAPSTLIHHFHIFLLSLNLPLYWFLNSIQPWFMDSIIESGWKVLFLCLCIFYPRFELPASCLDLFCCWITDLMFPNSCCSLS